MTMDTHTGKGGNYTLRAKSLLKRIESERTRQETKRRTPKEKPRPPPLSKYRRKTANARERNRMREINEGFATLQKTLPNLPGADADKLTKITVLKLAVNYIKILSCVMDDDVFVPSDIEELRELWCVKNAHMAMPEHCVRSVVKSDKEETDQQTICNTVFGTKLKPTKTRNCSSLKLCDTYRDGGSIHKKRSNKPSRAKGKICRTASVATNNGAYITLKNVAMQSSGRRPHYDNKPLMMSMTVKRQRMEPIAYQRPPKLSRYEPPVQLITKPKIQTPFYLKTCNLTSQCPLQRNKSVITVSPMACIPSNAKNQSINDNSISNFSIYDLDSPTFLKNDIFLELSFPRCSSSSPTADSSSYGSSVPSSPNSTGSLPLLSIEQDNHINASTPSTSMLSSPFFSSSDTDSVMTTNPDLDSILGSDPFEEELDHLTSSFVDSDDTLSLFLDHTSANFMTSDINSY